MSEKTSVWYLITALPVGGTERTLVDLANNIDTDRFDPTVYTVFDQNPLADDLDGVPHRTLGVETPQSAENPYDYRASDPSQYVRAPVRFVRAVRRERPNILQSFLFFDNIMARVGGTVSPETTVITGVRSVPDDPSPLKSIADTVTIRGSDMIVSNSEAGAAFAEERGAPADRVTVIRNGRNLEDYRNASPTGLREELGLPDESPVVGSIGRLIKRKGHHDLVAAWDRIRSAHPDSQLVLVGDGPQRESLRRQARSLNCSESIHLLGVRNDVPRLLALMDVFVFPSYFEGLPGALQEAMSVGLPIVATSASGNDELITHGETGLLVSVGDAIELGDAVDKLLTDTSLARSLGRAASQEATKRFSLASMVSAFENLYAAAEPRKPNE